jgi:PAS domain S-box-containing protein
LIDASKKVGGGDYNVLIDQDQMDDELSDLSGSFNKMTQNVRAAYKNLHNEMEERVRIEKEKYEFEKELFYITDNILDVIIQTDKEGKIIYTTPSIERTFGFSIEYMRGKQLFKFIHRDDLDHFTESFDKLVKSFEPIQLQYQQRNADGSYLNVETIGNPILGENLKISSVIFTLRDITDRIAYQESLRKAKEAAEKSDKIKTEFLAQMSHEIRTPVNTILNFAYLLQEEIEDQLSEDLKDGFTIIERGSRRLIRTIDSILNLSQLQFGSLEVHKTYIDLNEIIEQVVVEFKKLAATKNIMIKTDSEMPECLLYIDHYTVTQLIANLVDNAIKYTTVGTITISVFKEDTKVKLVIADTGIGMSKEFVEKLFEPFTQEETGYSRRFEGTGLGLALVKKYCEINKATIDVQSEKGKGTAFTICFEYRVKLTKELQI